MSGTELDIIAAYLDQYGTDRAMEGREGEEFMKPARRERVTRQVTSCGAFSMADVWPGGE